MTTNNGNTVAERLGRLARSFSNEGRSTDNIECSNTEETLRVVHALLLEHLGNNGDGRVDRVRDDEDESFGRVLGDSNGNVADDTGVDLCVCKRKKRKGRSVRNGF